MSNIIKSFQYDSSLPVYFVEPEELGEDEDAEETAKLEPLPGEEEERVEMPVRRPPPPSADQKSKEILNQAFLKAKQIVDSAQTYSSQQLQEASERISREAAEAKQFGYSEGYAAGMENGKKNGYDVGYRSGFDEGQKKAAAENRQYLNELSVMIESVEKSKSKILQDFESDLQELAIAIARAILKKELEIDDGAMRSIITNALDAYRNQTWVRIYVPEQTANILLKADSNIAEALKDVSENVKVISVSNMASGGCVLEMPDQVIEAGVDSQLRKIRSAIETAIQADQSKQQIN